MTTVVRNGLWLLTVGWVATSLVACAVRGSIDISDVFRKGAGPNWGMIGGGPGRTNQRVASWPMPPTLVWRYSPPTSVGSSMVVSDSLVYFSTLDGRCLVLNLRNGRPIGQLRYMHSITSGLSVQHQTAVMGLGAGKPSLYVYDLFEKRYRYSLNIGEIESNPLIVEDRYYVASQKGIIHCFQLNEGVEIWKQALPKPVHSSPSLGHGAIYAGCDDGWLYAFDALSGAPKWKQDLGAAVYAPPACDSTGIYVGAPSGVFVALDASDGMPKWRWTIGETPGGFYAGAAVDDEFVYVGASDGWLYAVDKSSGAVSWKFQTRGAISTAPVVTDHMVFVGSQDFMLYGLDKKSGAELWSYKTTGRIKTNPAIYGDYLLVASEGRSVYAFRFK